MRRRVRLIAICVAAITLTAPLADAHDSWI